MPERLTKLLMEMNHNLSIKNDPKAVEIENYLKSKLKRRRYEHVLSVRDTAIDLAISYDADLRKVNLAALLHDCAKWMSVSELYEAVADYQLKLGEIEQSNPSLLHAIVGAELAMELFGVSDPEIRSAIRIHTTGNSRMTLIDKILYIADFAEPTRKCQNIDSVRTLAYQDLDAAVFEVARYKIAHLLDKGVVIHPDTIAAYNNALQKIRES